VGEQPVGVTGVDLTGVDLTGVDLADLDLFAEGFPHEVFTALRREAPVSRHPPTPQALIEHPEPMNRLRADASLLPAAVQGQKTTHTRSPLVRVSAVAGVVVVLALAGCGGDVASTAIPRASVSTSSPVFVPDPPPGDVAAAITELVAEQGDVAEPGCAVSAVAEGEVVYEGGYGTADLATGSPIDARTTFDIASVSKQFTAAATFLLAHADELALDDEIHTYLPELPDYGAAVTLDDLVHHTSGLGDYTELLGAEYDDTDVTTTAQALDALVATPGLAFEPGTQFEYSNSNYFLLGLVVERVDGRTLATFLHDEVFVPLGMDHTVVRDDADLDVADGAEGYAADGQGGFEPNTTNWEQVGDGAVWTSVRDLQRWAANLATFEVGGPALSQDLLAPGAVLDEDGLAYAGGLTLLPGGQVEHSGAWAGFVSEFVVDPGESTSVAVLCNRDDADPFGLAEQVLALL